MAGSRGKRRKVPLPPGDLIWAQLEKLIGPAALGERPPDSVTVEEMAERRGISASRASAILRQLAASGAMRCVPFRGRTGKPSNSYVLVQKS